VFSCLQPTTAATAIAVTDTATHVLQNTVPGYGFSRTQYSRYKELQRSASDLWQRISQQQRALQQAPTDRDLLNWLQAEDSAASEQLTLSTTSTNNSSSSSGSSGFQQVGKGGKTVGPTYVLQKWCAGASLSALQHPTLAQWNHAHSHNQGTQRTADAGVWQLSFAERTAAKHAWLSEMVAEKAHEVARLLQQYDAMQLEIGDLRTEKGYNVSLHTSSGVYTHIV
jgi:hypothetical protein